MFYLLHLDKELEIQPRFFGPRLREEIDRRLRQEVEGTCNGKYGFIVCVMQSTDVGKGSIREGAGSATFIVKYTCVAFLPHKGEVLDTIVSSVNKMGFFAEAGPLTVFVSNHCMPQDFEFNTANEPCYISADGDQKIVPGSEVRLRIVGVRVDAHEIFAIGTIRDDWLGLMASPA